MGGLSPADASLKWFPGGSAASGRSSRCSKQLREAGQSRNERQGRLSGGVSRAGLTYERDPVGRRGQNFVQDQLQDGDGQQHGDLEAQLLASFFRDEERRQVQTQEEEHGQQEVDDVEDRPPLHGDLRRDERPLRGRMD